MSSKTDYGDSCKQDPIGELESAINILEYEIQLARDYNVSLTGKLKLVLLPDRLSDIGVECADKASSKSPLVERIDTLCKNLRYLHDSQRDLLERLSI